MIPPDIVWGFGILLIMAFFLIVAYFFLVLPIIEEIRKLEETIEDRLKKLEEVIKEKK